MDEPLVLRSCMYFYVEAAGSGSLPDSQNSNLSPGNARQRQLSIIKLYLAAIWPHHSSVDLSPWGLYECNLPLSNTIP